jgi:four helix bundle suffix protein
MNDEEFANLLLTLCHQTDRMMCAYVEKLEQRFVTEGGIKERMHAARTGYRKSQDEHMARLEEENRSLKAEIERLRRRVEELEERGGVRKS